MKAKSKVEKIIDNRIDAAYRATCSGIQINIMDIPAVFREGRRLLESGADEAVLRTGIRAYVEQLAVKS